MQHACTYRQVDRQITATLADRSQQGQHFCQWLASARAPSRTNHTQSTVQSGTPDRTQNNNAAGVRRHLLNTMQ